MDTINRLRCTRKLAQVPQGAIHFTIEIVHKFVNGAA